MDSNKSKSMRREKILKPTDVNRTINISHSSIIEQIEINFMPSFRNPLQSDNPKAGSGQNLGGFRSGGIID